LACGRFTIADLAVFPVLANAGMLRIDLAQYPEVTAWTLRMGQRAAWKKIDG
jgi:glutathione S-transferase